MCLVHDTYSLQTMIVRAFEIYLELAGNVNLLKEREAFLDANTPQRVGLGIIPAAVQFAIIRNN